MTLILRRTIGVVHVVAEQGDDGSWTIKVSDGLSREVSEEERREALETMLEELSSLRAQVWRDLKGDKG